MLLPSVSSPKGVGNASGFLAYDRRFNAGCFAHPKEPVMRVMVFVKATEDSEIEIRPLYEESDFR